MATATPKRMIPTEFLEWDGGTDAHHKLVRRQLVAMAPPSPAYGRTAINVGRYLANHLKPPCSAS